MLKKFGGEGGDVMVASATNLGKSAEVRNFVFRGSNWGIYICIYIYICISIYKLYT